jgi:hypothetical protein
MVEEAIEVEESLFGRKLPWSFKDWLLENNGLDIAEIHIYPVRDERDTRKNWESLSYLMKHDWIEGLRKFNREIYSHLVPFADFGTGDFNCFDYSVAEIKGERPIVLWSHASGETDFFAADFKAFESKVQDAVRD